MRLTALEKDMIHRGNLLWLLGAQAICIFPLLIKLPFWIWLVWISALIWRVQIHRGRWYFPSVWVKLFLGIGCAVGIFVTFSGIRGVEPMVGFLVCSFILKVIEMRTKKDALIVLFIGFIAVAAQFLFAQDVLAGIYGIFSLFILLTAWQAAFYSRPISIRQYFKIGGTLVIQALPFMVVLFIVMPRLGPLWAVPLPQGKGKTGFSDTLEMGDLGELVQSPEVAFRVAFNDVPPPAQQLYWRGLVLDEFDGVRWQTAALLSRPVGGAPNTSFAPGEVLRYSVIVEPHHYRWLFTLAPLISADSSQLRLEQDERGLLFARRPVVNKAEYSAISARQPVAADQALSERNRRWLTHLPEGNPRTRALVEEWQAQSLTDQQLVDRALALFTNNFVYTMRPPRLGPDAVDDFLFNTKRGFCEHFASSFVFLMRSAGIPARIIVGYQGGEYNDLESYFLIRQSDAHAWAEVWLDGIGWRAVDPTAAVAPNRIELGVADALDVEERDLVGRVRWSSTIAYAFYRHWDALGYSWNRWVLNYDRQSQQNLFSNLFGNSSPWRIGLGFVAMSIGIFSLYAAFQFFTRIRPARRIEDRMIFRLLGKVAKAGFERYPQETLGQFAMRVSQSAPGLGRQLKTIANLYNAVIYAEDEKASEKLMQALNSAERQLSRSFVGSLNR